MQPSFLLSTFMNATSTYESPAIISLPPNTLGIEDVILDSPVWRANIPRWEEQIEHFEKWVDSLTRQLRQYVDSLTKLNAQASNLCKQATPKWLDGSFIESYVTGTAIDSFSSALQNNHSLKEKLVSDIENNVLQPLQRCIKQDLKEFKDNRKEFEKALEKYEANLHRYSVLSRQKEASSLREDAFQLHNCRTMYTKKCEDYFECLVALKANLEQTLVGCFSSATAAHMEELDESIMSYTQYRAMLPGCRQWVEESKSTSDHQLKCLKTQCSSLGNDYIKWMRPHRSLKRYSSNINDPMTAVATVSSSTVYGEEHEVNHHSKSSIDLRTSFLNSERNSPDVIPPHVSTLSSDKVTQQGYLYSRITAGKLARTPWTRLWFFLKDGWFGSCAVDTINKVKGHIVIRDRIPVKDCKCKINIEVDRRFCFEVRSSNCTFLLQAETEMDLHNWLSAFEKQKALDSKTPVVDSNDQVANEGAISKEDEPVPRPLLAPDIPMTVQRTVARANSTQDIRGPSEFTSSTASLLSEKTRTALSANVSITSSLISVMIRESLSKRNDVKSQSQDLAPSGMNRTASTSGLNTNSLENNSSSWGMPWLMSALSNNSSQTSSFSDAHNNPDLRLIWPTKIEYDTPDPGLLNYTTELEIRQRELRRLFQHVPPTEVVIEAFPASLYHNSTTSINCLSLHDLVNPKDNSGVYGHSGHVYITQSTLWFYSCTMVTCINTLTFPLSKIESTRLERTLSASSQGMLMFIDIKSGPPNGVCFGLWLESAELVSERMKVAVEAAKSQEKAELQLLYDKLRAITPGRIKSKTPTNRVTPVSALNAAVTPLNVQAHTQLDIASTKNTSTPHQESTVDGEGLSTPDVNEPQDSRTTSAKGALTAAMKAAQARSNETSTEVSRSAALSKEGGETSMKNSVEEVWPDSIPKPEAPIECGCDDHLDEVAKDIQVNLSAKQLFDYMFSEKLSGAEARHGLWSKLNAAKGNGEPSITTWNMNDGKKERVLEYIMPVKNPMVKQSETRVKETHKVLVEKDYLCYVVMAITKTGDLPYADSFEPCIKFCITFETATTCRLACRIGVKWLKSFLVQRMVRNAAMSGMKETVAVLTDLVSKESSSLTLRQTSISDTADTNGAARLQERPLAKGEGMGLIRWMIDAIGDVNFAQATLYIIVAVGLGALAYYSGAGKLGTGLGFSRQDAVVWRAVSLRDIEPELTSLRTSVGSADKRLFEMFQDDVRTDSRAGLDAQSRQIASELALSREQLGALRYDLLTAFRMLNNLELRLLESEYGTWLLDERRRRCHQSTWASEACEEIRKEIEHIVQ